MQTRTARARRAAAAVLVAGLALAGAALATAPAHAAESHPTITITPTSDRALADISASNTSTSLIASTDLDCGTSATSWEAYAYILSGSFDASQIPTVTANEGVWEAFPASQLLGFTTGPFQQPGESSVENGYILPSPNWYEADASTSYDPGTLAPGTYTLLYLCGGPGSWAFAADGTPGAAWSTLTVSDSGTWALDTDPLPAVATTTAITQSDSSTYALTATVTASSGTTAPTGTVQFSDAGTNIGDPVALTPGSGTSSTATFTPTSDELSAGTHKFSASFAGSDGFSASVAATPVTVPIAAGAKATVVTVAASLDADSTDIDATATVALSSGGDALKDATGNVQFSVDGTPSGTTVTVSQGVASATLTGTSVGDHTVTAVYTPDNAATAKYDASPDSSAVTVTIPAADGDGSVNGDSGGGSSGDATLLNDGDTGIVPGDDYEIDLPAGTFGDGDTINAVLHSTPTDLPDGTAAVDGSLAFDFTLPADTPDGSHEIVFTDASDSSKTATVSFTVGSGEPGANGSGSDPSSGDPATSSNDPVTFATGLASAVSTPQGAAWFFGGVFAAALAAAAGWVFFWRRRSASRA